MARKQDCPTFEVNDDSCHTDFDRYYTMVDTLIVSAYKANDTSIHRLVRMYQNDLRLQMTNRIPSTTTMSAIETWV
jgi:hypothetical protein